jgi:hypothetical protein
MLDRLGAAYDIMVANALAGEDAKAHFISILAAMRWYADRIGPERWGIQPRQNRWSYEQRLWHLLHQVKTASISLSRLPMGAAGRSWSTTLALTISCRSGHRTGKRSSTRPIPACI